MLAVPLWLLYELGLLLARFVSVPAVDADDGDAADVLNRPHGRRASLLASSIRGRLRDDDVERRAACRRARP